MEKKTDTDVVKTEENVFCAVGKDLVDRNKRLAAELEKCKDDNAKLKSLLIELEEKEKAFQEENRKYRQRIDKLESEKRIIYEEKCSDYELMSAHLKKALYRKKVDIEKLKNVRKAYQTKLIQADNEIKELKTSVAYWKHQREVLEKSKLGKLTLKYWSFRDSLKRKFKGK